MRFLMMLLILVLVLAGCSNPELEKKQAEERAIKETISYRFAILSAGVSQLSVTDPSVIKINQQLDVVSNATGLSKDQIGDMAYTSMKLMREQGTSVNAIEALEVLEGLVMTNKGDMNHNNPADQIATALSAYSVIRKSTGQDHLTALESFMRINHTMNKSME